MMVFKYVEKKMFGFYEMFENRTKREEIFFDYRQIKNALVCMCVCVCIKVFVLSSTSTMKM